MRRISAGLILSLLLAFVLPAGAASGRVIKVLPLFLDAKGRHALTPSLYERDAYQNFLRQNPEKRSGMLFDVQCKAKGPVTAPLKLKIELRGVLEGKSPRQIVLEGPVQTGGWFGKWTKIKLTGQPYTDFGEMTAWRATLWEGDTLLSEQRSFLW
jgi:hypothetical protein